MNPGTSAGEAPKAGLAVQAFSLLVARTIAFVVALAMPLVVVRMLDKNEFGLYRLALTVMGTATTILPFSVGTSVFYFLPRMSGAQRHALIFNIVAYHLVIGTAVAVVFTAWPELVVNWTGTEALGRYAPLIGIIIATVMLSVFFDAVATANQDVRYSTIFIIAAQVTRAALVIGTAVLFRTVEALLYAWIIMGVIQCGVLFWYLHHRFPAFWRYRDRHVTAEQLRYVVPLGITALTITVQLDVHNYFVSNYFTPAQFAIYAVGTSQVPLIGIVRDSINSVMQARMSKLQQEDRKQPMLTLTLRAWRTLALSFLPAFAGLMLLAPDFIATLYGPKYLDSVPIMRLNLLLLVTSIFVTDAVIRAFAEHRYWFLRMRAGFLVVQIALSFFLTPYVGITGALLSMMVASAADRVMSIRLVFRTLGYVRGRYTFLNEFCSIALFSSIAAAVTWAVLAVMSFERPAVRLLMGMGIFGLSYVSALLVSGFLSMEERDLLKSAIGRVLRPMAPRLAQRVAQL